MLFLCLDRIFDSFSHDFGLGVVFVCDCFDRVLKMLFVTVVVVVVVVVVDFPAREGREKKRVGGAG